MEVLDVNIPVGGGLSLAPQEKAFLGRGFYVQQKMCIKLTSAYGIEKIPIKFLMIEKCK